MTQAVRTLQVGKVGELVPRLDAPPKVKGEFAYASDLVVPGMFWGHTLRSPHPHARILSIDIAEAVAMPGVHAVLTHDDVPGQKTYGLEFADQPVLAIDRVLYHGEPVALVAAEHPEQARRAAERLRVEYEVLEPVADMERALEATDLHPEKPTRGHGYLEDDRPNVVRHMVIRHGDPDARGDVSVSGYYEVGIQDQAFLGPESGLAVPDGEGGVDIYVATQWLHVDRSQVAPCLGLPLEQVRVHLAGVGGAFGGREDLSMQVHGALLALHTGRPVKIVYNREESFTGHVHRHPARMWCEHRATRDGKLVNVRFRILLDGGAYASSSTAVTSNAASFAIGPYESAERADRLDLGVHEQPTVRRDARVRRRADVLRRRGADGQARGCARHRPRRAAAAERAEAGGRPADRPDDHRARCRSPRRSAPPRRSSRPTPEALPRDVLRLPGGAGNTTNGEGVQRGVGFAVGFKNIAYSEGFDDYCAARVRLLTGRLGRGALRGRRGRPGRDRRDPAGRAHGARARRRAARAGPDGDRRLVGVGVCVADDVDGGRRSPRRLPGGARGAGSGARARRSTSRRSTGIHARRRSIRRPARSRASARTSRSPPVR